MALTSVCSSFAQSWSTLDFPGAIWTSANGIDGNNIVGSYGDSTGSHGFLYNGTTWLTLNMPLSSSDTVASGIDGSNIVGSYIAGPGVFGTPGEQQGFLYDGTSWATISVPGVHVTVPLAISRNNVVGYYDSFGNGNTVSLIYDGKVYGAIRGINARGISGTSIVGSYHNAYGDYSFLGDLDGSWTTLEVPGGHSTLANGISSNDIVGSYAGITTFGGTHGFLFDGTTWTPLDAPGAYKTEASDISLNNVVGTYFDKSGQHGFIYTIPEPTSLALVLSGVGLLVVCFRKR